MVTERDEARDTALIRSGFWLTDGLLDGREESIREGSAWTDDDEATFREARATLATSRAALSRLVAENERLRATEQVEAWVEMEGELVTALAEVARLTAALRKIADSVKAWHGPPPDNEHVRALAVIAEIARTALRGVGGPTLTPNITPCGVAEPSNEKDSGSARGASESGEGK